MMRDVPQQLREHRKTLPPVLKPGVHRETETVSAREIRSLEERFNKATGREQLMIGAKLLAKKRGGK